MKSLFALVASCLLLKAVLFLPARMLGGGRAPSGR
jgi:hypothetical protein